MPRLLFFYLAKRMALSALLIEVCLCVPVVMTSIFHYLPPTAVRSGLLMPALLGTMPTVLYIALPIAVGVAIMLEFVRMSSRRHDRGALFLAPLGLVDLRAGRRGGAAGSPASATGSPPGWRQATSARCTT